MFDDQVLKNKNTFDNLIRVAIKDPIFHIYDRKFYAV